MKKIIILLAVLAGFTFISCSPEEQKVDNAIELAIPTNLQYTSSIGKATITWNTVAKAPGYAYSLDAAAFVSIEGGKNTTLVLEGLTSGTHNLKLIAQGDLISTKDSREASLDFVVSTDMAKPILEYDPAVTSVSWGEVEGAISYKYQINGGEWQDVAEGEMSVVVDITGLDPNIVNSFSLKAVNGDFSSPVATVSIDLPGQAFVVMGEQRELMTKDIEGKYHYEFTNVAKQEFEVAYMGKLYAFKKWETIGGVGDYAIPYQNSSSALVDVEKYTRESIGQLTVKSEHTTPLWINASSARDVAFTFDPSSEDGNVRYYITMIGDLDASIIFAQYFDLFTWGSDFVRGLGHYVPDLTNIPIPDGTEPAITIGKSPTKHGFSIADNTVAGYETYNANRNLTGWVVKSCSEMCGYTHLTKTADLTTPAFGYAGDITVSFNQALYGGATKGFTLSVLGGGTISSITARVPVTSAPGTQVTVFDGEYRTDSIVPTTDTTMVLTDFTYIPAFHNNIDKGWTSFTIEITGATANTKLNWKCNEAVNSRYLLDNIVVKKK